MLLYEEIDASLRSNLKGKKIRVGEKGAGKITSTAFYDGGFSIYLSYDNGTVGHISDSDFNLYFGHKMDRVISLILYRHFFGKRIRNLQNNSVGVITRTTYLSGIIFEVHFGHECEILSYENLQMYEAMELFLSSNSMFS